MHIINKLAIAFKFNKSLGSYFVNKLHYVQGQEPEPRIREYFYYIDHQGMLFLDDSKMKNFTSCFKEKVFLEFFFKRIRLNKTGKYEQEFPYVSLCGRERNYLRCDDVPIVYTHVINKGNSEDLLTFNYAGDLLVTKFLPQKIYMLPQSGRVYHPTEDKYGGIALIRSKLAIEFSKNFEFNSEESPPTYFTWKGKKHQLDQHWFEEAIRKHNIVIKNHHKE